MMLVNFKIPRLNNRTKKALSVTSLFLMSVIVLALDVKLNIDNLVILFYISLFILMIGFEDELPKMLIFFILAALIFSLVGIVFTWLFKIPLPFIPLELTDNSIIAIFTVVTAIATIWNVFIYHKSTHISRLSIMDLSIGQDLVITLKNIGEYPARNIDLEIELEEIGSKGLRNFIKNLRDRTLNVKEKRIQYLSPGEFRTIDFIDYIKERFKLSGPDFSDYGDLIGFSTKLKKGLKFRIFARIHFQSDQFFKNPFPLFRRAVVKVNQKGSTVTQE